MRVHITFDIEVWCPGWEALDATFPSAFERYVWGRSKRGDYALPRNLDILQRHGLKGIFFVEPLFSLRFGPQHLKTITSMIQSAGQDVQLHLHPEWVDEIRPSLIDDSACKRQHLTDYTAKEQAILLACGKHLVEAATGRPVTAFRAGGYAVNRDSYRGLAACGLHIDSSLNATHDRSKGTLGDLHPLHQPLRIEGVEVHPVTVFRDGFGRPRHCQIGACSFVELRDVLNRAHDLGHDEVILVSHNFELLRPGSVAPDLIVDRRFDSLCAYLARHPQRFEVGTFPPPGNDSRPMAPVPQLQAEPWSTVRRYLEQARRRLG